MTNLVHVKWAGPNTPYIKLSSGTSRLILTKAELLELIKETSEFVLYYKDQFETSNVNWVDEPWCPYE